MVSNGSGSGDILRSEVSLAQLLAFAYHSPNGIADCHRPFRIICGAVVNGVGPRRRRVWNADGRTPVGSLSHIRCELQGHTGAATDSAARVWPVCVGAGCAFCHDKFQTLCALPIWTAEGILLHLRHIAGFEVQACAGHVWVPARRGIHCARSFRGPAGCVHRDS